MFSRLAELHSQLLGPRLCSVDYSETESAQQGG